MEKCSNRLSLNLLTQFKIIGFGIGILNIFICVNCDRSAQNDHKHFQHFILFFFFASILPLQTNTFDSLQSSTLFLFLFLKKYCCWIVWDESTNENKTCVVRYLYEEKKIWFTENDLEANERKLRAILHTTKVYIFNTDNIHENIENTTTQKFAHTQKHVFKASRCRFVQVPDVHVQNRNDRMEQAIKIVDMYTERQLPHCIRTCKYSNDSSYFHCFFLNSDDDRECSVFTVHTQTLTHSHTVS